ncbi:class I SAM-dependent methyltransferase [Streptomyces sp. G45]|uniref:class I SAM-dependent methyltransferase n=1 Tax=Streptomyces sp. G45 TaxID=3406627 RepID=UPI003C1FBC9E
MDAAQQATAAQRVAARRPAWLAQLAQGTERFHEPRRADCPWCGADRPRTRLRTTDLLGRKPGTFTLDECQACGHVFQNPPLTPQGRDVYGRDAQEALDCPYAPHAHSHTHSHTHRVAHALAARRHRARARALARLAEPESWLDVNTGAGHFPAAARHVLPYTAFDGLDPGTEVEAAREAGHVEEAHRGRLRDLAPRLEGRYDVVSLFHQLERAADPRAELRAAHRALRPGGHLVIEAYDPASRAARLLGRWWTAHGQPRHPHLLPLANLRDALTGLGLTVVAADRRAAHVPADLTAAAALLVGRLAPAPDVPWRAKAPGPHRRRLRRACWWAAVPLLAAAAAADHLLAPLLTRTGFANTYRVIAHRPAEE